MRCNRTKVLILLTILFTWTLEAQDSNLLDEALSEGDRRITSPDYPGLDGIGRMADSEIERKSGELEGK